MVVDAEEGGVQQPVPLLATRPNVMTSCSSQELNQETDTLCARMTALAKLIDSKEKKVNKPVGNIQNNTPASESWRSLLPEDDPSRFDHHTMPSAEQSWRSLLRVQSPGSDTDSHDMYLGPPRSFDHLSSGFDDDEDEEQVACGRRADLFVKRTSVTPIPIWNEHQRLPNMYELETASKHAGEKPRIHAISCDSSSNLYVRPMRPRSMDEVASYDDNATQQATKSAHTSDSRPSLDQGNSGVNHNDREQWPTSSRRQLPPGYALLAKNRTARLASLSLSPPSPSLSQRRDSPIATGHRSEPAQYFNPHRSKFDKRVSDVEPASKDHSASRRDPLPRICTPDSCNSEQITTNGTELVQTCDTRMTLMSTEYQYTLSLHVPHFSLEGITVATKGFNRRTLYIIATRWDNGENEFFERRVTFGADADMTAIHARFDGEHLHVEIPRKFWIHPKSRISPIPASPSQPTSRSAQ
ncbi:hypothetical protein MYAM1_000021 [Malassezia yamatoensis]|uniref:SHSP domain-containing protein n=1 Tax=Malassezia yamatoensis TaxID=253288 RepID=A0AAJ5YR74_9BASI|nr:hypothetical protein MYAM1_000021 [Malassezia yamatoensis]